MEAILGLAYFGLFGFAVWMWADALCVPAPRWKTVRSERNPDEPKPFLPETKVPWFVAWYLGGLVTAGIVPMAMSIHYYRNLRPKLRPSETGRQQASAHPRQQVHDPVQHATWTDAPQLDPVDRFGPTGDPTHVDSQLTLDAMLIPTAQPPSDVVPDQGAGVPELPAAENIGRTKVDPVLAV